jgi:hypothetical protein
MPREFRYCGLITDDTKVLFTSAGKMREIINEGFSREFARQRNARQQVANELVQKAADRCDNIDCINDKKGEGSE